MPEILPDPSTGHTRTEAGSVLTPPGAGDAAPRRDPATAREHPVTDTADTHVLDHSSGRTESDARLVRLLLISSAAFKILLAALATGFVLVDDAYIHLRYARNLATTGELVYNPGEAVFGLTSPLYGLVASLLYWATGPLVEQAVIVTNVGLWTLAGALLARRLSPAARIPVLTLFLLWPSLVDNQLLGMETPLFVVLLLLATGAALDGRIGRSAAAYGWALITRPEAVLLAPCLLLAAAAGRRHKLRELLKPVVLFGLFGPGVAWCAFAITTYGGVIPQSMLAKTGWNSEHYDALFTLQSTLIAVPRLTLLPFIDYLPSAAMWTATAAVIALAVLVLVANVRGGSRQSRAWAGFYALYLTFFLLGKGATEASWYSIPSTVALLLAAEPLIQARGFPRKLRDNRVLQLAAAGALAVACTALTLRRAPLLQSYVDGYGRSAEFLNEVELQRARVLIGEIGVYGFRSQHDVIDVGALVSPEILPMKNAGFSLCRMIQESGADYFVVSDRALEYNVYPSVGVVWENETELAWLNSCAEIGELGGKHTFRVPPDPSIPSGSPGSSGSSGSNESTGSDR